MLRRHHVAAIHYIRMTCKNLNVRFWNTRSATQNIFEYLEPAVPQVCEIPLIKVQLEVILLVLNITKVEACDH